jgi:lipopolysaccharide transport system permease protein
MAEEITAMIRYFHMWSLLGWYDIKHRYNRSLIGPFWITISTGVMVGSIGLMFSKIFKTQTSELLPHFAIGQIVWLLISAQMTEACAMFVQSQALLKQVSVPLSVHALRKLWYNLILFLHNFVIVILVSALYGKGFSLQSLFFFPGIALILVLLFFLSMILGIICTRFRDITQIVGVFLQLVYFFTPIFWMKKVLPERYSWVTDLNPFYHMIELVRSPLLGVTPDAEHWRYMILYIMLAAVLAFYLTKAYRHRVVYWL